MQDEEQKWYPAVAEFMARRLRIIQTEAGNATVGSGERHGDGDKYDAGSETSLLPLNDKGICAEGIFFNLDQPRGGVPVSAEIMAGRAGVGGRGSYRGHSVWNSRSELAFAGRTGTMAESGVRKGGLVKTIPPHQDGHRKKSWGCVRGPKYKQQPPQPGCTETAGRQSRRCARGSR